MSKRGATRELNHDNWDEDEEAEEAGTFQKASEEALHGRVIKQARRRLGASEDVRQLFNSLFALLWFYFVHRVPRKGLLGLLVLEPRRLQLQAAFLEISLLQNRQTQKPNMPVHSQAWHSLSRHQHWVLKLLPPRMGPQNQQMIMKKAPVRKNTLPAWRHSMKVSQLGSLIMLKRTHTVFWRLYSKTMKSICKIWNLNEQQVNQR